MEKGGGEGMEQSIKETLEKQLQLLSERSEKVPTEELAEITRQMVNLATLLLVAFGTSQN